MAKQRQFVIGFMLHRKIIWQPGLMWERHSVLMYDFGDTIFLPFFTCCFLSARLAVGAAPVQSFKMFQTIFLICTAEAKMIEAPFVPPSHSMKLAWRHRTWHAVRLEERHKHISPEIDLQQLVFTVAAPKKK